MERSRAFTIGWAVVVSGAVIAGLAFVLLRDRGEGWRAPEVADLEAARTELVARADTAADPGSTAGGAAEPIRPRRDLPRTGIAGLVVDDESVPVAEATIAIGVDSEAPPLEVRSDAAGRFASELEPGSCDLVVDAAGFGCKALRKVRVEAGRVAELRIVLAIRPELLGKVVDGRGAPVGDAEVVITYGSRAAWADQNVEHSLARRSDAGGTFAFPAHSDARTGTLRVLARKAGVGVGAIAFPNQVAEGVPEVRLRPARELTCRFAPDDRSPPPPGLRFEVRQPGAFRFRGVGSPEGVGIVPELPAFDVVTIEALAPGWWVASGTVPGGYGGGRRFEVPTAGDVEITVPLAKTKPADRSTSVPVVPTGTVEGRVVDVGGSPLAGVTVEAYTLFSTGTTTTTDSDGGFVLAGVRPENRCRVVARRGRGPSTWSPEFELVPGGTATGVTIVVGAVPDLVVDVVGADGRRPEGLVINVDDAGPGEDRAARVVGRTDKSGRATFEALASDRLVISVDPVSLPAGVCVDDGFDGATFVNPPMMAKVVIRLRSEAVIRGSVALEDGVPLGDATLRFEAAGDGPIRFARTNARGEYVFRTRSLDAYGLTLASRVVAWPGVQGRALETFKPVGGWVKPVDGAVVTVRQAR